MLPAHARLPKKRSPFENPLLLEEEDFFVTLRDASPDSMSQASSMSSSSRVPTSSRVFQFFSTLIFLVVTLTCGMFVRHSMTMSRLRTGDVRFPSSKQNRKMNSVVLKVVFDDETNPESLSEMIAKEAAEGKDHASVTSSMSVEDTVNSAIDALFPSTDNEENESPKEER